MQVGVDGILPQLDRLAVIGALKATGSTDPDVLHARKDELLADTNKMRLLVVWGIGIGAVCSLTLVLAVVGIPLLVYSLRLRGRISQNTAIAETAIAEYLSTLKFSSRT